MTDQTVVHIGENSPEQVAYKLVMAIAANEGKSLSNTPVSKAEADRVWLLDTYAECLQAVKQPHMRNKK
jgi:hypothetical protein